MSPTHPRSGAVPLRTAALATTVLMLVTIAHRPIPSPPPSPVPDVATSASTEPEWRPRSTSDVPTAALAVHSGAVRSGRSLAKIVLPPDPNGIRRAPVPILLYHHVTADVPATSALRETTVSPAALELHLTALERDGWTVVALDAVVDALALGTPLPPKAVVLTFDDGWRDQFDIALPILQRHGVTATFFITTEPVEAGWIGSLTWGHVKALAEGGMTIGAHTRTHRDLLGLSDAALADELTASADVIAARTGTRPRLLAYPYGNFDGRVLAAAAAAGYTAAVTANPDGYAAGESLLALPRIAVRGGCDTKAAFEGCVGAWLGEAEGWWEAVAPGRGSR
ncbi:MAG: polysaccharide deacetylase family protein [Ardenticatenales bacterium]|nr:polysaccharide deacetylase family protein [Ardenticatenales bacterium]